MRIAPRLGAIAATLLLLVHAVPAAWAQVIAWESFDTYAAGSQVNTSNGGYNWATPWTSISTGVTVQPTSIMPPLSGPQAMRINAGASNSLVRRNFNPATSDDVYFAVLLRGDWDQQDDFIQFALNDNLNDDGVNSLSFGISNQPGKPIFARVGTSASGSGQTTNGPNAVNNGEYLLIGRLSKALNGQYETLSLYINQFSQGAANVTATHTAPNLTQVTQFNIRTATLETSDTFWVDRVAIAGSFDELFPQLTTSTNTSGTAAFGNTRVGTTSTQALTAENTGSFTLTGLQFGDASNPLFARMGAQAGNDLSTGVTDSRNYSFTPIARGAAAGTATITGDRGTPMIDPNKNVSSTLNLTGTGVGPVFAYTIDDIGPVARSGTPLVSGGNNGNVPLATGETIDLGEGSGIRTAQLQLANVTTDGDLGSLTDLTILSGVMSGPNAAQFELFESDGVTPFAGGAVLSAGETLDLIVQFSGVGASDDLNTAVLTFITDQGAALGNSGGTFSFNLQAFQVPEPASAALFFVATLGCAIGMRLRPTARVHR